MSQHGIDFLRNWIKENINAAAYPPLNDTRAKVLAEQCAADAEKEGISVGEIEVDTGDLADCMLQAMAAASARKDNDLTSKGDQGKVRAALPSQNRAQLDPSVDAFARRSIRGI